MNTIAISPYLFMCMLQRQNVKRDICKKMDIVQPDNNTSEKKLIDNNNK